MARNSLIPAYVGGAAAELMAAAALLELGYDVMWPAVHSAPYDIVAQKGGTFQKVQVKRAWWAKRPNGVYLTTNLYRSSKTASSGRVKYKPKDFDLLMVVEDATNMWLIPHSMIKGRAAVFLDAKGVKKRRGLWKLSKYRLNRN